MERLRLQTVGAADMAFLQYIPGNYRPLLNQADTVCVGAVYDGTACGAALAESKAEGTYALRYIFVDPEARLCGLGTYLLRGLLGQLQARGARSVLAMYSQSMLEDGRQTLGILQRAGFSRPEAVSTGFSTQLGDIPDVAAPEDPDLSVYSALDAPDEVQEAYVDLQESGALPPFADAENLEHPWPELCSFSVSGGALSGMLLVDRKGEGCHLAGMYVLPPYRGGTVSRALIARSLQTANALLPPETEVWTSTIDRRAFALCDELMRLGSQAVKETEFRAVYQFQGGATDADLSDKTQSS